MAAEEDEEPQRELPPDDELLRVHPRLLLAAQRRLRAANLLGETTAEDVVQDAYLAFLERNPPADIELDAFLFTTIKQLVANHSRASRARDARCAPTDHELGMGAPPRGPERVALDHQLVDAVRDHLYKAAARDPEVLMILAAYEQGILKASDIRADLGFTREQYRHARRRLTRKLDELPKHLVDAVTDHLRRTA